MINLKAASREREENLGEEEFEAAEDGFWVVEETDEGQGRDVSRKEGREEAAGRVEGVMERSGQVEAGGGKEGRTFWKGGQVEAEIGRRNEIEGGRRKCSTVQAQHCESYENTSDNFHRRIATGMQKMASGGGVRGCCSLSLHLLLLLSETVALIVSSSAAPAGPAFGPQILINCGGGISHTDVFQRTWSEDNYNGSSPSLVGTSSETDVNGTENLLIYQSARVFPGPAPSSVGQEGTAAGAQGNPTYSLACEEASRYFLRLHFNAFPFTVDGTTFDPARAYFSVLADSVTLLRNWSPLLEEGGAVNTAVVKEFSLVCQPGGVMNVVFVPVSSSSSSSPSPSPQIVEARGSSSPPPSPSYAFINAIEHVYMPPGLYGAKLLQSLSFVTVIRWNCGSTRVSPGSDRLFRTWLPDPPGTKAATNLVQAPAVVAGCNVAPAYVPADVMESERVFGGENPQSFSVDYKIPAEANATYFVRMYFADLRYKVVGVRVMELMINGVVREDGFDSVKEVGALNATWRDFVVDQSSSASDTLFVSIKANPQSLKRNPQINGLEVFKLGQSDLSSSAGNDLRIVQAPDGTTQVVARPPYSMEAAAQTLRKFTEFEGNAALLPQWMAGNSDPCTGWTGVRCAGPGIVTEIDLSYVSSSAGGLGGEIPPELGQLTTLTSVVLSKQRFTGSIPNSFGNLSFLQNLALDNNQLTGSIPASFASLRQLESLAVQFNSLSGEVPEVLLKSATLTTFLSVGGNNSLCAPSSVDRASTRDLKYCSAEGSSREKKGTPTGTAVAITVVGAALLILLTAFLVMMRRRRRENDSLLGSDYSDSDYTTKVAARKGGGRRGHGKRMPDSDKKVGQRFTLQELRKATDDFDHTRVIGTGGFGNVYKGVLEDGDVVAIKRGSPESKQGVTEFQTEIVTLSKLRHRHLVSLVGYCDDEGEMILVYEFMALGTLRGHLYGKTCGTEYSPLSWRKRLEICIGSARGLDYLHSGVQEMVIHRDVKSTNILLDDKYVAKVADFGLSKSGPSGFNETHVSTAVKGSFGYLDPAYFKSQQLTEKSDVYSFGVVLLEVITARSPISQHLPKEQVNLADWAVPYLSAGKVEQIVDPKLVNTYGTASLYKLAEVALRCLGEDRDTRPSMTDVRRGLEDSLMLQDTSLSVVLDTPPAPMMCVNYDSQYHDYTNATDTTGSEPPSPPDSVLMAR
ncbi:hypothetical protein CBR_g23445 [Chara braunii]|uniref:non-specific serine/threonine protein kinase n=1 Tax=Chara braunii TaxID=69332 RepID=A0A388L481_CHABU|nr:hypothetical protein CBR_g23445 [Chara braunii]|eukprot:GBG77119.1 hypothetical protein CBR_g23445 [Chara braunii]